MPFVLNDVFIDLQEVTMPLMSLKLIAAAKDSWACLIRACFRDLKILSMKLVAGGQSCHQVIY